MKIKQNASQWKLLEMLHIGDDPTDTDSGAPLQWMKFAGTQPEAQGPIVILAGFNGPARNESRILQLLQRALANDVITTVSDLYLCPIVNPTSQSKAPHLNCKGNDIFNDFPTKKNKSASDIGQSFEVTQLLRWINKVQPKAVLSLQADKCLINHFGCSDDILEKLTTLSERHVLGLGESPKLSEEEERDLAKMPEDEVIAHNYEKNVGEWCNENDVVWINFSVDGAKKDFEELREDWRLNTGPALKWLLEGPRFNPPVEEPFFITPIVVQSVDLPPELMNL
ncbi:MAG: hypothetical protein ABIR96_01455 [Bdellovibrionota bacterium]